MSVGVVALLLSAVVATIPEVGCLGLGLSLKLTNDPQCKKEGQQCSSDLSQIIYCTGVNGNSYLITSCVSPRTCRGSDEDGYECGTGGSDSPPPAASRSFTCSDNGIFPDPYRCNTGYICSSKGKKPDIMCECPNDHALTLYPKFGCTNDGAIKEGCSCPETDRCNASLEPNDFGANCHAGYFYTCSYSQSGNAFVASVFRCPTGEIFFDGKCQKFDPASGSPSSAAAGPMPECKPYQEDRPCQPEPGIKCSQTGELLPHKKEKRCYYQCDENMNPNLKDCGSHSHFECKDGLCGCVFGPE